MKMTKPIKLVLITAVARYLQSICPLHRVCSDRAQYLNNLLERGAANPQGGDVLEGGALKNNKDIFQGELLDSRDFFLTFILSQSHCANLSIAPCLSHNKYL